MCVPQAYCASLVCHPHAGPDQHCQHTHVISVPSDFSPDIDISSPVMHPTGIYEASSSTETAMFTTVALLLSMVFPMLKKQAPFSRSCQGPCMTWQMCSHLCFSLCCSIMSGVWTPHTQNNLGQVLLSLYTVQTLFDERRIRSRHLRALQGCGCVSRRPACTSRAIIKGSCRSRGIPSTRAQLRHTTSLTPPTPLSRSGHPRPPHLPPHPQDTPTCSTGDRARSRGVPGAPGGAVAAVRAAKGVAARAQHCDAAATRHAVGHPRRHAGRGCPGRASGPTHAAGTARGGGFDLARAEGRPGRRGQHRQRRSRPERRPWARPVPARYEAAAG